MELFRYCVIPDQFREAPSSNIRVMFSHTDREFKYLETNGEMNNFVTIGYDLASRKFYVMESTVIGLNVEADTVEGVIEIILDFIDDLDVDTQSALVYK
jgi:hypothetical protein